MSRVIGCLKFRTGFFGPGYEHNLYDVDVADVELSMDNNRGTRYWYLTVRGKKYEIAPVATELVIGAQDRAKKALQSVREQLEPPQSLEVKEKSNGKTDNTQRL